ncbi:MAG TPA: cytochrome c oxidase subunit 3, partial [Candidatus Polarisedimenticolaceae bacterium]|nr:cytochrome c oxidase subunit 3 [Candidatus Polarisedimenticolaceae bacterium]
MSAPGHPAWMQHHFDTPEQQYDSSKFGMWLFLATEILLFGGLFCAYAIYRANHPEIFAYAHTFLDKRLGAFNTIVLLCSSLTMAWAVRAAQLGQRRILTLMLALTLAGGGVFLGVKFVEYKAKFEHGLLWARRYAPQHAEHAPAPAVPPPTTAQPTAAGGAVPFPEHTALPA